MKTYYIKTYGCQMNKSDSENIAGLLEVNGIKPVKDIKTADIVVFNTCCVRESAENKFYGKLSFMKSDNNKLFVVAGCLAKREKEKLYSRGADIILGPQNIDQLPDLIKKKESQFF